MSLRDDVRELRDMADGLLVGWTPGRLPRWSTSEGAQLAWLIAILWRKYYDASMERIGLQARVARLEGDVDGLRETNARLTDLLDQPQRDATVAALAGRAHEPGYYWLLFEDEEAQVAYWDGKDWYFCETECPGSPEAPLISGRLVPPSVTNLLDEKREPACGGCGVVLVVEPEPELCEACHSEALHHGVDPTTEELLAARRLPVTD